MCHVIPIWVLGFEISLPRLRAKMAANIHGCLLDIQGTHEYATRNCECSTAVDLLELVRDLMEEGFQNRKAGKVC